MLLREPNWKLKGKKSINGVHTCLGEENSFSSTLQRSLAKTSIIKDTLIKREVY